MQFLFHQQMNIISAIALLLFLMYAGNAIDRKVKINNIYIVSLSLNLILIALDVAFNFLITMNKVSIIFPRILGGLIFVLSPLLPYLFLQFICSYFSSPFKLNKVTKVIFTGLLVSNAVVAIFSFKSRTFIESMSSSEYIVPYLISILFLVYNVFVIFKCKKMLINFEYIYIIAISLLTCAFVLVQLFTGVMRFIWCFSSFTLILMYIVIQQRELYRDALTGARNRLVFKKCLDSHIKKPGKSLSVVMIDLDYFKNINDSYGHSEGDYALKVFTKLLQKVFSTNGIVIRMGGDEFLILIYKISTLEVNELIKKMSKLVDKYNSKNVKPYLIKYSCASGTYSNSDISIDQFIHEIDMKMYQNKSSRKGKVRGVENI